ncbi:MAG: hypothetical protein ACTHL1_04365 [Burkholderiaceae bacterium]
MKPHSLRPEFPLDPTALEILRAMTDEAASAGIECMIVGATARDILLTHVFGIPARRATHDVDFAVAIENWDQFEQMKSRLAARKGFEPSSRMKQRLYYLGDEKEHGHPLDLVREHGRHRCVSRQLTDHCWHWGPRTAPRLTA